MRLDLARNLFLSSVVVLTVAACKDPNARGGGGAEPTTDEEKTYYALGEILGRNAQQFKMTPEQVEFAKQGFADAALGNNPKVELSQYGPKVNELARQRAEEANKKLAEEAQKRKDADKPFLDAAKAESGAKVLANGAVYKSEKDGTGATPKATDYVKVNYTGKLSDGTVFDSSDSHGGAQAMFLNRVVPCWTQGVQEMKVGGKAKLTCPSETAYGDRGQPPKIPGGATLQFDIELVSIEKPPAPMNGMMMGPGGKIMLPVNPHGGAAVSPAKPAPTGAGKKG